MKAAKLGGAVVAVFLLAAWRVVGAVSPPKPDAPPPETVGASTTSPTNGAPAPSPSDPAKPDEAPIELTRPTLASMIDPFRTIAPDHALASERGAVSMPLPLAGGPLPSASSLPAVGGTLAPAATIAVESPMKVTGILSGPNATAVIETGKETSVVRVGSRLPDGSEVVVIDVTTVTVRQGGKKRVLDVGN